MTKDLRAGIGKTPPPTSDRWRVYRFDGLPAIPDAPWRQLGITVHLRLARGRLIKSATFRKHLPDALSRLMVVLVRRGFTPPFVIDLTEHVTFGHAVKVGRLEVGRGTEVEWTWGPIDFPLGPEEESSRFPGSGTSMLRPSKHKGGSGKDFTTGSGHMHELGGGDFVSDLDFDYENGFESLDQFPETTGEEIPEVVTGGGTGSEPAKPRVLQCRVGPDDPQSLPDNVLRIGDNIVGVFLGPEEAGALVGDPVSDADLGFEDAEWVVVKVQLTPLEPAVAPASVGDLLVPRSGRTATLPLPWKIPATAKQARAQLAVTRDGRVIAVAELTGKIGKPVKLVGRMSIGRPDEDRPGVGRGVHLNSDASGTPTVVVPSQHRVELLPHLEVLAENIRDALNKIVNVPTGISAAARRRAREMLVAAAQAGRDLYLELEPVLGDLTAEPSVQIVTALAPHSLPLELLYLLPAPGDDAPICPTWLAGGECGPSCGGEDGTATVCPAAFWGISRVVERFYQPERQGEAVLQVATPNPDQRSLGLDVLAYAASSKVTDNALSDANFDPAHQVTTWADWRRAVAAGAGMLVLLPHTLPKPPTLEVSGHKLHRSQITRSYVEADVDDALPAVVLFG